MMMMAHDVWEIAAAADMEIIIHCITSEHTQTD